MVGRAEKRPTEKWPMGGLLSGYSRLPILTHNALSKGDFRRPDDGFRPTFRAPDDPLPTSSLTVNEPDRTINSIPGYRPCFQRTANRVLAIWGEREVYDSALGFLFLVFRIHGVQSDAPTG